MRAIGEASKGALLEHVRRTHRFSGGVLKDAVREAGRVPLRTAAIAPSGSCIVVSRVLREGNLAAAQRRTLDVVLSSDDVHVGVVNVVGTLCMRRV
jgi:hypothetical protein